MHGQERHVISKTGFSNHDFTTHRSLDYSLHPFSCNSELPTSLQEPSPSDIPFLDLSSLLFGQLILSQLITERRLSKVPSESGFDTPVKPLGSFIDEMRKKEDDPVVKFLKIVDT